MHKTSFQKGSLNRLVLLFISSSPRMTKEKKCMKVCMATSLVAFHSDITFAVGICARYQVSPHMSHLHSMKRILKYVLGRANYGLWYTFDMLSIVVGFCDADWVRCIDDRESTSSGCFFLGNNLTAWFSKKQNSISLSISEAEYITAESSCNYLLLMKQMLSEYGIPQSSMLMYCDNLSAIRDIEDLTCPVALSHTHTVPPVATGVPMAFVDSDIYFSNEEDNENKPSPSTSFVHATELAINTTFVSSGATDSTLPDDQVSCLASVIAPSPPLMVLLLKLSSISNFRLCRLLKLWVLLLFLRCLVILLPRQLAVELMRGTVRSWPCDGQLPSVSLSMNYAILHKIDIVSEPSSVSRGYAPDLPSEFCHVSSVSVSQLFEASIYTDGLHLSLTIATRVFQVLTEESRVLANTIHDLSSRNNVVDSVRQELHCLVSSSSAFRPPS
ncbi:putative mitochondrial protein [Cucumis melo var. makuwa]|uniref:Mitochondrial protein n=1 Tax=Cucumis melo var. makuwa TaxID=1194695 RepID=A0A5A7SPW3_CUCMM|nr:putative mitochondrial protein [Cucumis melo var. makuwa]